MEKEVNDKVENSSIVTDDNELKKVKNALLKRAIGYVYEEESEEYGVQEGKHTLVKHKITKKEVPPDLTAIKMILSEKTDSYEDLTLEELEKEKLRLLKQLKILQNNNLKNDIKKEEN